MDQNMYMNQDQQKYSNSTEIENEIASKRKLLKLHNVIMTICIICIFMPFIDAIVESLADSWHRFFNLSLVIFAVALILGFAVAQATIRIQKSLKELVGQSVVRGVLEERIQVLEYVPNGHTNDAFLKSCSILPSFNNMRGSDYIHGIYNGVEFTYSDITLRTETKSTPDPNSAAGDNIVNFSGSIMTIALRKNINGFVQLMGRMSPRKKPGEKKGILSGIFGSGESQNSLRTGYETFDDSFDIYVSDDQLAFSILTPRLMEAIMSIKGKGREKMEILFAGSMIVVAQDNDKDIFELEKKIDSDDGMEKYRQKFRREFSGILNVIDVFGMNTDLFH